MVLPFSSVGIVYRGIFFKDVCELLRCIFLFWNILSFYVFGQEACIELVNGNTLLLFFNSNNVKNFFNFGLVS